MKTHRLFLISLVVLVQQMLVAANCYSQKNNVTVGAYYYDGWSGLVPDNLTRKLMDSFPERKPVWGWVTSDANVMQKQIDLAADYGISFFCFDWFFPNSRLYTIATNPTNRALKFYLDAPNKNRIKFSLLVVNTGGQTIRPKDWNKCVAAWIDILKDKQYLYVDGKPLISFFSHKTLLDNFGSADAVHAALDSFRTACVQAGLPGITIAAGVSPLKQQMDTAKMCGFDMLTGYNYSSAGYKNISRTQTEIPIDTLRNSDYEVWNRFKNNSNMPYLPVVTLNWDPRPKPVLSYYYTKRYTGYSLNSTYNSVKSAINWINRNPKNATKERVILLYAWNEYNEGAWLTPSDTKKDSLLLGVKAAISEAPGMR